MRLTRKGSIMIKIHVRQFHDRFIFIIEIPIHGKTLYWEVFIWKVFILRRVLIDVLPVVQNHVHQKKIAIVFIVVNFTRWIILGFQRMLYKIISSLKHLDQTHYHCTTLSTHELLIYASRFNKTCSKYLNKGFYLTHPPLGPHTCDSKLAQH